MPDDTIPRVLARRRREDADRQALVMDDDSITFAELDDASRALAARLVAAGMNKGSRVGLQLPNGIDWATAALAVMRIGAVLVPLSTLLKPPELQAQLDIAAVTHLVDDLPAAAVPEAMVRALEEVVRPADDMVIMFTSGSRGAPKGVIHTHGNALRATAAGLDARCVGRGERLYIPMPFFWMGGFGGGLLSMLLAGATLLTEARPEPGRTLELLERERVTLFRGWPDQAARIAAHPAFADADLSSLRPGSLAAVLPPEQRPAPGARANLFGMTESFGPYCGDRDDLPPDKHGSCGRPFAGVEVRIVEGEIWLRGPNMLRGICGRDRAAVFTEDGFYRTGDLGRLDDDGYLWYSGRLDDMFKVKGATVYPSEVEAALRSVPEVAQAYVADVDKEVGALVVSPLDRADIETAVRARLSSFKVPTVWLVVDDPDAVPLSATGKVDKARLQQLLRGGSS